MKTVLYSIIFSSILFSQSRTIGLEEALRIAAKSNFEQKIKQLDIDWGDKHLLQGYLNFAPVLTLDYSYVKLSDFNLQQQQSQTEGFKLFILAYANDLTNGLDAATRNQLRAVGNNIPVTAFEFVHRSSLNIRWPLFAKGLALAALSEAKNRQKIAEIEKEELSLDVKYKVREAFYNLLIAQESLSIQKHRLQNVEKRVAQIQRMLDQGLRNKAELMRWKSEAARIQTDLIRSEGSLEFAQGQLAFEMGLRLSEKLFAKTSKSYQKNLFADITDERIESIDSEKLKQIRKSLYQLEIANSNKFYSYGKFLPSVDISWNKSWNQSDQAFPAEQPWEASLNFSWELFSSFKDVLDLQKNELRKQQAELQLEQNKRQIRLSLNQLYSNLKQSRKQLNATDLASQFAEENYRIMKNRYDQSLASNLELLDSEVQYFQSKLDQLSVYKNYLLAGYSIKRILGQD